jgi:excisionase family DNA binding protein
MFDNKAGKRTEISNELGERLRSLSLEPDSPPLTVAEAATLTNTSQKFWRTKIYHREIKYLKIGRSVRIPATELVRVIKVIAPFIIESRGA